MDTEHLLDAFERLCVAHVLSLRAVPHALEKEGFSETQSLHFRNDHIIARCWEHPDLPYGISYLEEDDGAISSCGIMIPHQPGLQDSLIAYVEAQDKALDVTEETIKFLASAPEEVARTLTDGRFWTSKPPSEVGRNFSVTEALFELRGGTSALALTVDRNLALQDAMTQAEWDALTGPDGKLQQCIDFFHKIALAHAPDPGAMDEAAKSLGFTRDRHSDDLSYAGGHGHRTTSVHINCDTNFDFEFALSFILDERIPGDLVRQRLFDTVGLGATKPGGWYDYDGAWGEIELRGKTFRISGYCESKTFGNHTYFLQW